ncbi:MAG: hypothetical protein Q4P33_00390 [Flaviflexus sp.]|nr:hypothetical protein [Flaviflexus sp.]
MTRAHAVTKRLRAAFAGEDEEMLDMIATLAAADESLMMDTGVPSRLIVAADGEATPEGELETSVRLTEPISRRDIVAIFADEREIADEVVRARRGDEEARAVVDDAELLWYHPSEIDALVTDLTSRAQAGSGSTH